MSLFLGVDAVAAPRGDGLRPELRMLMLRHAHATGPETRNGDPFPPDSISTDAFTVIESHQILVSEG